MGAKRRGFRDVQAVAKALEAWYGTKTLGNKKNPFNELLYILLSSKTPPGRYQQTYSALRRRFSHAEMLAHVPPRELVKVIKSGGLAQKKAKQISAIARQLKQQFGRVTLAPLKRMSDREAEELLTNLPGIGVKSARCVLLFALERDVFPVDAHCFRIVTRVGWWNAERPLTEQVADEIQKGIPGALRRSLHVNFVLLGREFCTSSGPRCGECPVISYCKAGACTPQSA